MTDIRRELLAAFEAEYRDHLSVVRAGLARAAADGPVDLKDLFRRVHSLKGAARAVDLPVVEEIAHALESFFAAVVEGRAGLDAAARASVEAALDAVEAHVAAADAGREGPDPAPVVARLEVSPDGPIPSTPGSSGAAAAPAEPETAGRPNSGAGAGVDGVQGPGPKAEAPAGEWMRVAARTVETLDQAVGLLSAESLDDDPAIERLAGLQRRLAAAAKAVAAAGLRDAHGEVRAVEREIRSLIAQSRRRAFAAGQAVRRVEDAARAISMVPADTLFGGFGRLVREMGRDAGHEIEFRAQGLDLAVDRRVLQALKDPVLHALRNAVGHGAEPPAVREAAGKPAALGVALSLEVHRSRLTVTVSDDGRGPDLQRIEAVARRNGLLPAGAIGPVSADRLLALVFEPGFSTAETVDRLSGRGMGLSVVAEAVRAEHGSARLQAGRPHGTVLVLDVPLAARLQSVVRVEVDGATYGIPAHGVERLIRVPAGAIQSSAGRPVVWIESDGRHVVVPIATLASLIGPTAMPVPVAGGFARLLVLRRGGRRVAVAVEAMHDAGPMKIESLAGYGGDPRLVAGAVVHRGAPAVVLDPDGLIDRWLALAAGPVIASGAVAADTEEARPTILVVDDSITMRTLQRGILEGQGYRVAVAVDGAEAIAALRSGTVLADLVVADVEMPRMDGFALLGAIRADARFERLPVVLMTSRAAPEDVRRGLDLGADAYITKQRFDQRELLAIIGQLIG